MEKLTKRLIVISFDGLSTLDFEYIKTLPNFGEFLSTASYCSKVHSIYPSLTYPAHTSIITGKYPKNHGVINNTLLQPGRETPDWYWYRRYVKGDTLYDLAIDQGMSVAALLWPVTARSRIQYNMPEIFANRPWQNQIMVSLGSGSPLYQYKLNKEFGHLRQGTTQPYLDNFTHQALLHTLRHKKPELILVHFTDLDSMRHFKGFASVEAQEALRRHDARLGEMIQVLKNEQLYEESTIILLGDHSSLDEDKIIHLNVLFREQGWITVQGTGHIASYEVISKNCDGSAYIYFKEKGNLALKSKVWALLTELQEKYGCLETMYTGEEAAQLGADPNCDFMLEAVQGYYFLDSCHGEVIKQIQPGEAGVVPHVTVNTHGYSPYKENYTTVFMAAGKGIKKGAVIEKMSLIDEGPTMARLLGLNMKDADGSVLEDFLDIT